MAFIRQVSWKGQQTWAKMLDAGLQPDIISYNIQIKGFCSLNRIAEASEFFDEALTKGITPTLITWSILVRAMINFGLIP
jgi:pentatricopeptide repeat protein